MYIFSPLPTQKKKGKNRPRKAASQVQRLLLPPPPLAESPDSHPATTRYIPRTNHGKKSLRPPLGKKKKRQQARKKEEKPERAIYFFNLFN
jgi:hypothetical protein